MELDRADFDRIGSYANFERRHSALTGPGPEPGLVLGPELVLGLPELVAC